MRAGIALLVSLLAMLLPSAARADPRLKAGFAELEITPDVQAAGPVWIAGYGQGRRATGIHDPLMARGMVLDDGRRKIALVSVDLVGLQYPAVQQIRAKLPGFRYVMVSSTHNHEGPDVIGIWGRTALERGVDDRYIDLVIQRVVELVRRAEAAALPARAEYGTARDDSLLGDSRLPRVYDGVLRVLRFRREDDGRALGLLVQWNCHPESLGSRNTLITADFPYATVAALRDKHRCPVAYFTGPVGGLMAPPDQRIKSSAGEALSDGSFEYAEAYGREVAALGNRALEAARPIELTPLAAFARPIAIPLANPYYQMARSMGVLRREGRVWTGDFEQPGPVLSAAVKGPPAVETEVAYLRLGELHVACIPGEIYPELVYGAYQDPAEPNVDFPEAPLETPVMKLLPGDKALIFGLANDEIGYIIPKRQWDQLAPFAYGRKTAQYGEINSCGPEIAPIVLEALRRRVQDSESDR
jgi:hypothetical protein